MKKQLVRISYKFNKKAIGKCSVSEKVTTSMQFFPLVIVSALKKQHVFANATLKQFLVQGYAINERRLQEKGVEFSQAVALLSSTLANQALVNDNGKAVIEVVQDYARTWSLLQAYDEQSLSAVSQKQTEMLPLIFDDVLNAIAQLKQTLIEKGEATALFGQLRSDGLASAVATIEQGFGDEWFYPNVASRAAHLLYFVIKNHPLSDGNNAQDRFYFSGIYA